MFAILSDRSKQTRVQVGDVINCDLHSDWSEGDEVSFDDVLLVSNEGETTVGQPTVAGAKVTGKILGEVKGKKEVVFRFKRRKNVRVKKGHRQHYAQVEITGIQV